MSLPSTSNNNNGSISRAMYGSPAVFDRFWRHYAASMAWMRAHYSTMARLNAEQRLIMSSLLPHSPPNHTGFASTAESGGLGRSGPPESKRRKKGYSRSPGATHYRYPDGRPAIVATHTTTTATTTTSSVRMNNTRIPDGTRSQDDAAKRQHPGEEQDDEEEDDDELDALQANACRESDDEALAEQLQHPDEGSAEGVHSARRPRPPPPPQPQPPRSRRPSYDCHDHETTISEEVLDFFETTRRHREQRELEASQNHYEKLENLMITSLPSAANAGENTAAVFEARQRELKQLYGTQAPTVQGMEMAMQCTFEHFAQPNVKLWPNIPLRI